MTLIIAEISAKSFYYFCKIVPSTTFDRFLNTSLFHNDFKALLRIPLVNVTQSVRNCGWVTFTEEIFNGKLYLLRCYSCIIEKIFWDLFTDRNIKSLIPWQTISWKRFCNDTICDFPIIGNYDELFLLHQFYQYLVIWVF